MNRALVTAAAIFGASFASAVMAEPMPAASLDEAARSPHVLIASYQGHQPATGSNEDIYFNGVTANYKVDSVLKQPAQGSKDETITSGKRLDLQYLVHDLSPCMADQTFRFSDSVMPAKGSRWILFLQAKVKKEWQTYRGSEGRLPASEANINLVKKLLSAGSSPTRQ